LARVSGPAALVVEGAHVVLDGRTVLDGGSLSVSPGERVAVVGPNGAGKTTLLRAALGLQPLAAGTARLGGEDVRRLSERSRAERVGYLPQERRIAWGVAARRIAALGAAGRPPQEADRIADQALARVGLADLADRSVFAMSGGERARVLLARLLATGAPLLVADEPAAGLDPDAQLQMLDQLTEAAGEGRAVVATLHDLTLAARWADRVAVLDGGRLVADAPPLEALRPEVLRAVFRLDGEWLAGRGGPVLSAVRTPQV
jgi:iron complex transport system ATP-binding protein